MGPVVWVVCSEFYPLRARYPALALRHMVPTDVVFMDAAHYSVAQRKAFLQGCIECMGKDAKTKSEVVKAKEMLAKIED